MFKKALLLTIFLIPISSVLFSNTLKVSAATCSWTGSVDNTWANSGNWSAGCSGAGGIPGDGDDLIFPAGMANRFMNNNIAGLDLSSMTFETNYRISSGNEFSITNGMSGNAEVIINTPIEVTQDQTWSFIGDGLFINNLITLTNSTLSLEGDTTIDGIIEGTGNLIVMSGSTVSAMNGNTFEGNITIDQGTFIANGGLALGNSANNVILDNGTLELNNGINIHQDIIVNAGLIRNGSASNTISGNIELNSNLAVSTVDSTTLTISGIVSGTGPFYKEGTGLLILNGNSSNTYTGTVVIVEGTLRFNKTEASAVGSEALILVGNNSGLNESAILEFASDDQIPNDAEVVVYMDGLFDLAGYSDFF